MALFTQDFTITATAGNGGSISPAGATTVPSGGGQAYSIAADAGFHIFDVFVDGVSVGVVAGYEFTNVTADHTISATFEADGGGGETSYHLAYLASAGGMLAGETSQTVAHGSDGTTVTAVADPHYHFVGWDDLVLSAERRDLAVTADATHTALFELAPARTAASGGRGLGQRRRDAGELGGASTDHRSRQLQRVALQRWTDLRGHRERAGTRRFLLPRQRQRPGIFHPVLLRRHYLGRGWRERALGAVSIE